MKFTYPVGKLTVEFEASTHKEAFKHLSSLREVFGHEKCGNCGSTDVNFVVRDVADGKKTYAFHEMHCNKCRARLAFGQHSEGDTLFPKRKDDQGNWLDKNGWVKWEGKKEN